MRDNYSDSKYRWYVLSLAALTLSFCMAMPIICMSVLFDEISTDLGLSVVQVGWIWGSYPLSSLFTVFIAGLLADRFGPRRTLTVSCILVGLAGASRGLATNFISLITTTLIFGLISGIIPANAIKGAVAGFSSRQLGLASGILTTGMGVGFTIASMSSATLLSPMLGGWNRVLFLYGGISILIALLWFTTFEEPQPIDKTIAGKRSDFREAIWQVLHNRNVWLISLTMLGYVGCIEGMNGYLPLYLRGVKEWLPASADGTLALFTGISTLGAIPITLLSDRLGRRKIFMLPTITIAIMGVGLLSIVDGIWIWWIVLLVGIGRDGFMALANASTLDSEGIGTAYSGTAIGLLHTISKLGGSISPPIGNSLVTIHSGLPFIAWAAFGIISMICFSMTRETGHYMAPVSRTVSGKS